MKDLSVFYNALMIEASMLQKEEERLQTIVNEINQLRFEVDDLKNVRIALTELSKSSRKSAIDTLESLTNQMLQSTIEAGYSFSIETITSGGKPSVRFFIIENINGIVSKQDIVEAAGGGIQDVVSTALRYAFILTLSGGIKGPVVLDEPARMISEENSPLYAQFLSEMSKVTGKQIIMCTHNRSIEDKADNLIKITKKRQREEVK